MGGYMSLNEQETQSIAAQAESIRAAHREKKKKKESKQPHKKHTIKLTRASEKLPILNEKSSEIFAELSQSLSTNELLTLIANLAHFVRVQKTTASSYMSKIVEGSVVEIMSSNSDAMNIIGKLGNVVSMQSIHAMVNVEGKEYYLFRSDFQLAF